MRSRVTETGFRYAVCSLQARRSELNGQLVQLRLESARITADLAKVDDALRLLDPDRDPTQITTRKAIKHLNLFKQGELGRILIGILRTENRPMGNIEIARIIFDRSGYEKNLWNAIRCRCRANLEYLRAQGRIRKIGKGINARWTHSQEEIICP